MTFARKYGPPASLALSVVAAILAGLGRKEPVDRERLRKFEAEASFHATEASSLARKLDGAARGIAALEDAVGALEKKLSGARPGLRESYTREFRGMFAEYLPQAIAKARRELRAAMTPEAWEYYKLIGEARRALRLDEKKAKEFARILVQEKREQRNARRKFGRDRKKRDARMGEIKRGVEERLRGLLTKEEYERYESWRKAGT